VLDEPPVDVELSIRSARCCRWSRPPEPAIVSTPAPVPGFCWPSEAKGRS